MLAMCLSFLGTSIALVQLYYLRSVTLPISAEFGYANYLPIQFWMGIGLLLLGAFLSCRSPEKPLAILPLVLLSVVLWAAPSFAETLPQHPRDALLHIHNARWLGANGNVEFSKIRSYSAVSYLQYPALAITTETFLLVTTLSELTVMMAHPIFLAAVFAGSLYLLSREVLNHSRMAWLATIIVLVGNVSMFYNYYSASASAAAFSPLSLLVALRCVRTGKRAFLVSLLLLFFWYSTLHAPTSILLSVLLIGACMFARKAVSLSLLFLVIILPVAWAVYVANISVATLASDLRRLSIILSKGSDENVYLYAKYAAQTTLFPLVGWVKRAIFAMFTIPAALLTFMRFYHRRLTTLNAMFIATSGVWVMSVIVTNISDRYLVWVVPLSALLVLESSPARCLLKRIVRSRLAQGLSLVALLVLATFTFATFYSGQASWTLNSGEYVGFKNLVKNLNWNDRLYGPWTKVIFFFSYHSVNPNDYGSIYLEPMNINGSTLAYFNRSELVFDFWQKGGNSTYPEVIDFVNKCSLFNRVYSNPDFCIYRRS